MSSRMSQSDAILVQSPDQRMRFDVIGTDVQVLAGKDRTDGVIEAVESRFPPGKGVPAHYHNTSTESVYVLEGELSILGSDSVTTAPTGAFVHLPVGIAHGFENRTTEDVRVLIIWSPPLGPGVEAVFGRLATLPPGRPDMSVIGPMLEAMDMNQPAPPTG